MPFGAEPHSPGTSDLPPTGPQETKEQQSQDLDVSMSESTVASGDTMCLHDLDEGAIAPPTCTSSVPILAKLAKAIEEELNASSGVREDPDKSASGFTTRPALA